MEFVKPHVIDMSSWKRHDTMMLALLLFSYLDFEPIVYERYGNRLGAGIIPALQTYRATQQSSPASLEGRNFNLALVLYVMHHFLK